MARAAHDTMMNPAIEELLDRVDSKFALVTLAARRARQINSTSTTWATASARWCRPRSRRWRASRSASGSRRSQPTRSPTSASRPGDTSEDGEPLEAVDEAVSVGEGE
jgi:DNA-directed RNA polymerase omega subunit